MRRTLEVSGQTYQWKRMKFFSRSAGLVRVSPLPTPGAYRPVQGMWVRVRGDDSALVIGARIYMGLKTAGTFKKFVFPKETSFKDLMRIAENLVRPNPPQD